MLFSRDMLLFPGKKKISTPLRISEDDKLLVLTNFLVDIHLPSARICELVMTYY